MEGRVVELRGKGLTSVDPLASCARSLQVALLSGKHVPNSEELLGRATKEELVQVFGTGYDAGYKAGRKRNRIEDLVVRQVNKQLKHQPKPEEKKDEAKEEEEG